jgi:hypothetical protein
MYFIIENFMNQGSGSQTSGTLKEKRQIEKLSKPHLTKR